MKNPFKIWFIVPFSIVFTIYTFYHQIILNQIPPIFQFSPSVNSAILAWASQSKYDITGQLLLFQFTWIGILVVYLEWTNYD